MVFEKHFEMNFFTTGDIDCFTAVDLEEYGPIDPLLPTSLFSHFREHQNEFMSDDSSADERNSYFPNSSRFLNEELDLNSILMVSPITAQPLPSEDNNFDIFSYVSGESSFPHDRMKTPIEALLYDDALEAALGCGPSYNRFRKPVEYDHNYSAPPKDELDESSDEHFFEPYSPASSTTSSEVDVVTVKEEPITITVPKKVLKAPARRGRKPKNPQTTTALTAKSFKAAIENNRITNVRRTNRKKISHSLESSPSHSMQSSAHNSRCNSDEEDRDKRSSHNKAERHRRNYLKDCLQKLRVSVPATEHIPKAPKVLILNSARDYINELKVHMEELQILKQHEERNLKHKLNKLKVLQRELLRYS